MNENKENLRITIEQKDCLAEVIIPSSLLEEHSRNLVLKEFLQNSMVDLHARLRYMIHKREKENG